MDGRRERERERGANLAANDGDGGKGFPQSRQGGGIGAVVAEDRAGALNSVDECDQGVHWFMLRGKK